MECEINHKFLLALTITYTFGSAIQVGYIFNEQSMVNPVLGLKLGWVEDGSADFKYLLL